MISDMGPSPLTAPGLSTSRDIFSSSRLKYLGTPYLHVSHARDVFPWTQPCLNAYAQDMTLICCMQRRMRRSRRHLIAALEQGMLTSTR